MRKHKRNRENPGLGLAGWIVSPCAGGSFRPGDCSDLEAWHAADAGAGRCCSGTGSALGGMQAADGEGAQEAAFSMWALCLQF